MRCSAVAERSPHPFCKLCGTNHPLGGPHAWDKPSGTKEQRMAIADAVLTDKTAAKAPKKKRPGSSAGSEQRVPNPQAAGSSPAPATKPRGRPKLVEDRKAYLAQKARERRARQKAEKSNAS